MVFCVVINCRNDFKFKVSIFKFFEDLKFRKEWLIRLKREFFEFMKYLCICVDYFIVDCF